MTGDMNRCNALHPNWRDALRSMGGAVLLLSTADIAFCASIVAVRVWPAAEYTRVTIESAAQLAQKHFITGNPARVTSTASS